MLDAGMLLQQLRTRIALFSGMKRDEMQDDEGENKFSNWAGSGYSRCGVASWRLAHVGAFLAR
jgi:hypothetical protein